MTEEGPENTPAAKAPVIKGVGGWLAFLIVSMGVLSPLVSLYFFFRNTPEWHIGVMISFVIELMACAVFIFAAYRLYRHHAWRSVQFAVMALWVGTFALSVFIFLFTLPYLGWVGASHQFDTTNLLKQCVYPTVWTLYLLMSSRVRHTYRRENVEKKMAYHFGIKE